MIQYPKYKPTGIDWINEIPDGWVVRKLKSITSIKYGNSLKEEDRNQGDIAVYGSNGIVGSHDKSNTSDNTIILGRKGSYGKVNFSDSSCFVIDTAFFIDETCTKENLQWLLNIFICLKLDEDNQDSAVPGLSREKAYNNFIPVPSNKEKSKIVEFIINKSITINNLIEKQKRLIELLKEKRSAIITEAVTKGLNPNAKLKPSGTDWIGDIPEGWEVRKLKWVAKVKTSNVNKKTEENEIPVRLCNYVDVYKNEFIDNSIDFMEASASVEEIAKFRIKSGDVIITKDSEDWNDIAIPAYIKENFNDVLCGYHLSMFRPVKDTIDGQFLFRALQSKSVNHQFKVSANGITRFGLSTYSIASSILPVPPLKEQILIVKFIDKKTKTIDKLIEKAIQVIEKLGEYKQALITEAVTGKICVTCN